MVFFKIEIQILRNKLMANKLLMVRADASSEIGVGHIMRTLVICDALKIKGYECIYFTSKISESLSNSIIECGYKIVRIDSEKNFKPFDQYSSWLSSSQEWDADQCLKYIARNDLVIDLVIVDSYSLDYIWEEKIRPYCNKIITLDDLSNRKHDCDILVDTCLNKKKESYDGLVFDKTLRLVGSQYSILREEFLHKIKNNERINNFKGINSILISFGGTDPEKLTLLALNTIKESGFIGEIKIIISSACHWLNSLNECKNLYDDVTLLVDHKNPSDIMSEADFCIGSSGGMAIERCVMGLPSLILTFSENQIEQARSLEREGMVIYTDKDRMNNDIMKVLNSNDSHLKIKKMTQSCLSLTDGYGAGRICIALDDTIDKDKLTAIEGDWSCVYTLYMWQRDAETRRYFKNVEIPTLDEHIVWYKNMIQSSDRTLFLIWYENIPIGYVRLDLKEPESYEVSIFVDTCCRSKGIALWILEFVSSRYPKCQFYAYINNLNLPSKKTFIKAGYKSIGDSEYLLDRRGHGK